MSRTAQPLEPPSGPPPLDERWCATKGAELAAARAAQGLSLAAVADRLLLSMRQARALEHAEVKAFYSASFFLTALRKYAALLGVTAEFPDPQTSAHGPTEMAQDAALAVAVADGHERPGLPEDHARTSRRAATIAVSAIALALLGVGASWVWTSGRPPESAADRLATPASMGATPTGAPPSSSGVASAPPPAPEPLPVASPPPAPAPPAPPVEPAPVGASDVEGRGSFRVGSPTWIFLRYANGEVVERTIMDGEKQVIESPLTYLAIGIPDVDLVLEGRHVDVTRYVVNGQVRMRAADFAALASGAQP